MSSTLVAVWLLPKTFAVLIMRGGHPEDCVCAGPRGLPVAWDSQSSSLSTFSSVSTSAMKSVQVSQPCAPPVKPVHGSSAATR